MSQRQHLLVLRFMLDADKASLRDLNKSIRKGELHRQHELKALLPIVGREAQQIARFNTNWR